VKLRLRGFTDQELIEGGEPAQARARDELRREQRLRVAMSSGWPELPRSDLAPAHFGLLEHKPTGEFYSVSAGEQSGGTFDTAAAFYIDQAGDPVFLERPASGEGAGPLRRTSATLLSLGPSTPPRPTDGECARGRT
jgi:hypothetical protein